MSVKVINNTAKIVNNTKLKANIFLRLLEDEIVKKAEPNTPRKYGNLRRDILKQVLGLKGKIIWGKDYAYYQETKQFKNYTTPNTGPRFAKNAVEEAVDNTEDIARKAKLI